ncbi:hypothetical protein AB0C77_21980, partial [Streptomyces sp. NPDC048629]
MTVPDPSRGESAEVPPSDAAAEAEVEVQVDSEVDAEVDAQAGETGEAGPVGDGSEGGADGGPDGGAKPAPTEAEAELAAQREERARIERRKADKDGPVESGAKLSGKAADLLAAVRAVEAGEKSGTAFYENPAPAPRRSAPE